MNLALVVDEMFGDGEKVFDRQADCFGDFLEGIADDFAVAVAERIYCRQSEIRARSHRGLAQALGKYGVFQLFRNFK